MSILAANFSMFTVYFLSLDSEVHQKINVLGTEIPRSTLKSNDDAINLSFLLCPSGIHIANF